MLLGLSLLLATVEGHSATTQPYGCDFFTPPKSKNILQQGKPTPCTEARTMRSSRRLGRAQCTAFDEPSTYHSCP